jgi:hypothetical protein
MLLFFGQREIHFQNPVTEVAQNQLQRVPMAYTNVIKIRMETLLRPLNQDYTSAGEFTYRYNAGGIGLIYTTYNVNTFTKRHWQLQKYVVK